MPAVLFVRCAVTPWGSFWEALGFDFGAILDTFGTPDRIWDAQNRFQKETWKSEDFGSVLGAPGQQQADQNHAGFGGVSPYKETKATGNNDKGSTNALRAWRHGGGYFIWEARSV